MIKRADKGGGLVQDNIGTLILVVVGLVIILGGVYLIISGKLTSSIEYVKQLFRFGNLG